MMDRPVSIRVLMDNISAHPMMRGIPEETVVRHVVDFMRIMACPLLLGERTARVRVECHRGELPCDFLEEVAVRGPRGEAYRAATAAFAEDDGCRGSDGPTYMVKGGVIHTSLPEGEVSVRYRAVLQDDDGFPLIPDDAVAMRAMEAYVKVRWFTVLFDMGRVSQASLANAQQEYAWCAGQCDTRSRRLTPGMAESLLGQMRQLAQRSDEHARGFAGLGDRERWRAHNG